MTEPGPLLSVIVCTRDRAGPLARALESLVGQDVAAGSSEIVVVDNGSTDGTRDVVRRFASRADVVYVYEPTPGLGRARNAGLRVARGRLIAFTDDDVIAHADWIQKIVARLTSDPGVAVVFGYTYGADHVSSVYSLHTASHLYYLNDRRQVWESTGGNNLAFRREALARVGAFDPRLGAGARYPAAEDAEWIYRLLKAGLTGVYDPAVRVEHAPDLGRRPVDEVIVRDDAGAGAWLAKHAAGGDAYALRMFGLRLARAVGGRSLLRALTERRSVALRLRARRIRALLTPFVAMLLEEVWRKLTHRAPAEWR